MPTSLRCDGWCFCTGVRVFSPLLAVALLQYACRFSFVAGYACVVLAGHPLVLWCLVVSRTQLCASQAPLASSCPASYLVCADRVLCVWRTLAAPWYGNMWW